MTPTTTGLSRHVRALLGRRLTILGTIPTTGQRTNLGALLGITIIVTPTTTGLSRHIGTLLGRRLTILGTIPTTGQRTNLGALLGITIIVTPTTTGLSRQIGTLPGVAVLVILLVPAPLATGAKRGEFRTFVGAIFVVTPAAGLSCQIRAPIGLTVLMILSSTLDIEIRTVLALVIAVRLLTSGRSGGSGEHDRQRRHEHQSHHQSEDESNPSHTDPHESHPFIARWDRPVSPLATSRPR